MARALRLTDAERDYLFALAHVADPVTYTPSGHVRPGVLALLDALAGVGGLVVNARYEVLAWNALAAALIIDFSTGTRGPGR